MVEQHKCVWARPFYVHPQQDNLASPKNAAAATEGHRRDTNPATFIVLCPVVRIVFTLQEKIKRLSKFQQDAQQSQPHKINKTEQT